MNNTTFDHLAFRLAAEIADNTTSAHLKMMDIVDRGTHINYMDPPSLSILIKLNTQIESTIANLQKTQQAITKLIEHG